MKVVFTKSVENAKQGDVKEVADGYARNYLLPRGMALAATPEQLRKIESQREAEAKRTARVKADAEALAQQISGLTLRLPVKVGAQKRLHGSVTAQEIVAQLKKQHDLALDRRDVALADPIKRIGDYQVPIHIGHGLDPKLKVSVVEETE